MNGEALINGSRSVALNSVLGTLSDVDLLINGRSAGEEGQMGICTYCGTLFPKTRSTRKYCTPRCKTNACLTRKPSRIRAADVQALYALLDREFTSAEVLQERLRAILAPAAPPLPLEGDRIIIPRLD
jgi:hypothetical protein